MDSSKKRKNRTTAKGTKITKITKPGGRTITRRTTSGGAKFVRRTSADGQVTRITKRKAGEAKTYGKGSSTVRAANRIARARQIEKTTGAKATGTAGRIARLQARRRAASKAGKMTQKGSIQAKIKAAKDKLRKKIEKRRSS